jgi:crotonobetainyl-CoA:carnitine CoA-transferase CaiB-like acyl-CoA transferase
LIVLDLSCDVAGGFAAKLLALGGFDVVRPIYSQGLDPALSTDPLDVYLHAHKRLISGPTGAAFSSLVNAAGVVFTTFDRGRYVGPGREHEEGAIPETCVHITTSTFGTTGPYAALGGGPLAGWAAGGYLAITGDPDREPLIGPEHLCGYVAGYTAAVAAEAALQYRRRTGSGLHVDVSTMEAMLSVHQSTFSRAAAGFIRERTGRYTEVYPLVVRPCRDGYVSLGVVTEPEFDRFAIAIGRADLATDVRFADQQARWAHRDELDAEIGDFLSEHGADDVVAILQAHGVAAAKVAEVSDLFANPQLSHRDFWEQATVNGSTGRMPGQPVRASTVFAGPRPDRSRGSRSVPMTRQHQELPLAGILVVDFTAFWAGPLATRWLADLGADVIWVERPHSRPDTGPSGADPDELVHYLFHTKMNRHKRSVVLDVTNPDGLERARRLAGQADVLIENLRPGVMDRLGLGPSVLCAANPDLVYVSLSGFGATGPWASRSSYGPTIEAASSVEARTGYPGGEPLRLGHALPDAVGGLAGALAALRGLREREERGHGGWFDISQLEAYTAMSGEDLLHASTTGCALPRLGNRSRSGAMQGVFPCAGDDQWVAIRLEDRQAVGSFAAACGLPEVVEAAAGSSPDQDVVDGLIASVTARYDKHAVAGVLQAAGLEAVPVLNATELLADPHLHDRGFFVEVPFHDGVYRLPGSPVGATAQFLDPVGTPPRFGEHTGDLLVSRPEPPSVETPA